MRTILVFGLLGVLAACGGDDNAEDSPVPSPVGGGGSGQVAGAGQGGGEAAGSGGSPTAGAGGGEVAGSAGAPGATIRIHLASSTATFPHGDGLSGQTPITHTSGLRSYRLFKDKNDTAGVPVFDLGKGFVEVSYDDGADTVVAEVPLTSIPEGVYTRAQVVHTHVRYRIKATAHNAGFPVPGEFDNLQVMSDGTTLDGVEYKSGHYRYVFTSAGVSFPLEGEGAPVPVQDDTGGFSVSHAGGQWIYEFPVNLAIDHQTKGVIDAILRVNMFESFRWKDEDKPGYAPGVFDVTSVSFEPVQRFGANSFSVVLSAGE